MKCDMWYFYMTTEKDLQAFSKKMITFDLGLTFKGFFVTCLVCDMWYMTHVILYVWTWSLSAILNLLQNIGIFINSWKINICEL